MKEVIIYTDGACRGNPGPGGWAALLIYNKIEKEVSGGERYTTNQKMELRAAVEGLKCLKEPCKVKLYSDSAYLVNAFRRGWLDKWQKNGWKTVNKDPVENQDLWKELLQLSHRHDVLWFKVKGHSDDERNNRCDYLARQAVPTNS
ncbi:MAG: ribonuclease HI [Firmicutes bacterium]|nr:ribonuclease HI [Bacillota bacterium]